MYLNCLPVVLLLFVSTTLATAQDKLPATISAAIGYPLSFGDNSLEDAHSILALDVNVQLPVSGKMSVGPSYRASIYGTDIVYTDESGNDIPGNFSSMLHHLEVLAGYQLRLDDRAKVVLAMAGGYTFLHNSTPAGFPSVKAPEGYNLSPGITFQFAITDHLSLLSSAKYTFSNLNSTIDAGGVNTEYNESIHEVTLTAGAAYKF